MLALLIFVIIGLAVIFWLYTKKRAKEILKYGFHTKGTIIEYKTRFVRVAGQWTWLKYPYVEYADQDQHLKIDYVKYTNSYRPHFKIGQEIELVKYDNVLYYKNSL